MDSLFFKRLCEGYVLYRVVGVVAPAVLAPIILITALHSPFAAACMFLGLLAFALVFGFTAVVLMVIAYFR